MKNHISTIICLLGFAALVVTSCKKDEDCIDCKANDIIKTTIRLGSGDSTITIYPVMTPSNHDMCDSMVYHSVKGAYVRPYDVYKYQKLCSVEEAIDSLKAGNDSACPCRKNLDTIYNDPKNSYFYIENLQKFPYNKLLIKTVKDSTQMRTYLNYDNRNDLFIGEVPMDTTLGYYQHNDTRPLASGIFAYYLIIYKDEMHQTIIGDTIKGKFAIVRNPKVKTRNCKAQAHDEDDPLLK